MIYKTNKENLNPIHEGNEEDEGLVLNIKFPTKFSTSFDGYIIRSYKVHFTHKGISNQHQPRYKFMLGNSNLGFVKMLKSEYGYFYVCTDSKCKWSKDISASQKSDMIELAIALTEFLGVIYYDYYNNYGAAIYERKLSDAINEFNSLSTSRYKMLVKTGKQKAVLE